MIPIAKKFVVSVDERNIKIIRFADQPLNQKKLKKIKYSFYYYQKTP
ncbi:hypothetical protein VP236O401_P0039 [Vibrio phage 236O40-1]|nr:hypothetical protein VP236O401_P0039 [Vibrio phage 236O40-1]